MGIFWVEGEIQGRHKLWLTLKERRSIFPPILQSPGFSLQAPLLKIICLLIFPFTLEPITIQTPLSQNCPCRATQVLVEAKLSGYLSILVFLVVLLSCLSLPPSHEVTLSQFPSTLKFALSPLQAFPLPTFLQFLFSVFFLFNSTYPSRQWSLNMLAQWHHLRSL